MSRSISSVAPPIPPAMVSAGIARRKVDQDEVESENRRDQRGGTEEAAPEDDGELHASGIRNSVSGGDRRG